MLADPVVEHMTDAQWAFEVAALRLAEEDRKEEVRQFTEAAKGLLGLNLFHFQGSDWVPLSMVCGNHHMVKRILEDDPRFATEEGGQRVAQEEADFDAWSAQMAAAAAAGETGMFDDLIPHEEEMIQPRPDTRSPKVDFDGS